MRWWISITFLSNVIGTPEETENGAWESSAWEYYYWYGKNTYLQYKFLIRNNWRLAFWSYPQIFITIINVLDLLSIGTWRHERNDRIALGNLPSWSRWGAFFCLISVSIHEGPCSYFICESHWEVLVLLVLWLVYYFFLFIFCWCFRYSGSSLVFISYCFWFELLSAAF